jgi:hypothetical protein
MANSVLIPALVYMNKVEGTSIFKTGKNTQMNADPIRARVTLNLDEI